MTLTLRYAARSDRGLIRDGNQDSVYAGPRLLAVADGMGGMAAGDVASNIVIEAMAPLDDDVPGNAPIDMLRSAVELANQQLRDAVDANPAMEGMGTTLTAMLFSGTTFGTVHIGDSRAYLLRDGEFAQITKDDTYVQMLVDEGRISAEEASSHPQRSLLTRALDGRDVDPDYRIRPAVPGDRYLICSDGLTAVVSPETISETMQQYREPAECVERLVQLALRGGGPDNITVIVVDVTDEDIVEQRPMVGGAAARDRGMGPGMESSTPASRASALAAPRPVVPVEEASDEVENHRRRHPVRAALVLVVLLAILVGAGLGGWYYTQTQYYVGATDDGRIAVFQGIHGRVAGVSFSKFYAYPPTEVTLDKLKPPAQDSVKKGIPASSADEAQKKILDLFNPVNGNLAPCPTPTVAADLSPSPAATGLPVTGSGTPAVPTTPATSTVVFPPSSASASVSPQPSPSTPPNC